MNKSMTLTLDKSDLFGLGLGIAPSDNLDYPGTMFNIPYGSGSGLTRIILMKLLTLWDPDYKVLKEIDDYTNGEDYLELCVYTDIPWDIISRDRQELIGGFEWQS